MMIIEGSRVGDNHIYSSFIFFSFLVQLEYTPSMLDRVQIQMFKQSFIPKVGLKPTVQAFQDLHPL